MSKKKKAAVVAQPAQPATPQPYKYTFRPVHLETPVDIIQRFNYVTSANQQFQDPIPMSNASVAPVVAEEPVKEKKKKCKVRKAQNFFFVLTLLVLAAVAGMYFLMPDSFPNFRAVLEVNKTLALADWKAGNYIFAIAPFVAAAFLLAIVVRWLLHPLSCKVRKGRHCCGRCEFLKYVWTVLVVGVAGAAALVVTQTLGFDKILASALNVVNLLLAGGMPNDKQMLTVYCLAASVVVLVLLVIISIAHKAKDKRRKLLAEEKAYVATNKDEPADDLANPNHAYGTNASPKKSRKAGKVILVLLVLAVAAVAVLYALGYIKF